MSTDIIIITLQDIMNLYGFTRKQATKLVNTKGCPLIPRVDGAPYRVIKDEFEKWLRNRHAE